MTLTAERAEEREGMFKPLGMWVCLDLTVTRMDIAHGSAVILNPCYQPCFHYSILSLMSGASDFTARVWGYNRFIYCSFVDPYWLYVFNMMKAVTLHYVYLSTDVELGFLKTFNFILMTFSLSFRLRFIQWGPKSINATVLHFYAVHNMKNISVD